jgi:sugar/nucleoside kinase (ribokinase family)
MSHLLVVGSVAFDSIETNYGKRERILGGSANYFSLSASFFAPVRLVGVVGEDFPPSHIQTLNKRGIDTAGLQFQQGDTFHWSGSYLQDINEAQTIETRLNVFEHFLPQIPDAYCDSQNIFLANIDPDLQLQVLEQIAKPRIVACDTMNFWISSKRTSLLNLLKRIDIMLLNEKEAFELSGHKNLISAAHWLQDQGPQIVIIKRGEYGALLFYSQSIFWAPAFPLEHVRDPTGAGDTFGGGAIGYLSTVGQLNEEHLRRAIIIGSVMASFNVEDFSFERLLYLTPSEIIERYQAMQKLVAFDGSSSLPLRSFS